MSISKKDNSPYYYTRFTICKKINGKTKSVRIQESTKCMNKLEAEMYEAKRRIEVEQELLHGVERDYTWVEAKNRWLVEKVTKRTYKQDLYKLMYLDKYFKELPLSLITSDRIEGIAQKIEETTSAATVNRTLSLIKSILTRAYKHWEWIKKVPYIRMRKEPSNRIRYLTRDEANRLLQELPEHLRDMAKFTLNTGLRASNVLNLRWENIDFERKLLFIPASQFKTGVNFSLPLNQSAMTILLNRINKHPIYVFTYSDQSIGQCNTRAWRNALKRAGIEDFRWHDLRHTWASWHIQNGTSLHELQQLGGWSSFTMVLRYAHLSQENLQIAANRLEEVL